MTNYFPEGELIHTIENRNAVKSVSSLKEAMQTGMTLEAKVQVCDNEHNLIVDLNGIKGIIPRIEGAMGIETSETKDIALISKVNKPVCFKIIAIVADEFGKFTAYLSRKTAQEECMQEYVSRLAGGDVIPARITHLEKFGCFVDIGCGIPSLIPIDAISVSRISHPSDRFFVGQKIKAVVKAVESGRVWLTHKELLGTWQENAAKFNSGETVAGIIRSVESYGIFVELSPNLAGLAEARTDVKVGQFVSVYIKAIIPEKMKIKLIIVDVFDGEDYDRPLNYFVESDHIDYWKYSTENCDKLIESRF